MRLGFQTIAAALCCALLAGVVGCQSSEIELHPVKGTVTFDGKPPEGATVTLRPVADSKAPVDLFPTGAVKADGSFELGTYAPGDGAPAGAYKVIISWVPEDAPLLPNGRFFNKLPDRYSDWKTTPLKIVVEQGPNDLPPYELSSKKGARP